MSPTLSASAPLNKQALSLSKVTLGNMRQLTTLVTSYRQPIIQASFDSILDDVLNKWSCFLSWFRRKKSSISYSLVSSVKWCVLNGEILILLVMTTFQVSLNLFNVQINKINISLINQWAIIHAHETNVMDLKCVSNNKSPNVNISWWALPILFCFLASHNL